MFLELEPVFEREGGELPFAYEFTLDDPVMASPVRVTGRAFNKTGVVRLEAEAGYTLKTECARCSGSVERAVRVPVSHVLLTHLENEADDDDLYIVCDRMHLDLDALVAEDIVLAMPPRWLCRPDCKGLCSICGADLNEGDCGCSPAADPRWDALKDMF